MPSLTRWWFYQQFYAAIAVTVYAILWAVGQPPDPRVVILYAFCLGNLNTLAVDLLRIYLPAQRFRYDWMLFTWAEFCVIPPIFIVSTAVGFAFFSPAHMTPPFWRYVATGWKIPALVLPVWRRLQLHRQTRDAWGPQSRTTASGVKRQEGTAGAGPGARPLIQRALLPKNRASCGFEVEAAWEPAQWSGRPLRRHRRDTKLGITIADVVGKGVSAAL